MHVRILGSFAVATFVALAACSVTSSNGGPGPGDGGDGGPIGPDDTADGGGPNPQSDGGDGGGSRPPASTTEAPIDVDGTCSAFTPCGGSPQGTFDYVSGCIEDVFADVRTACPTVDTSGASVKVAGSIHFVGDTLFREATTRISGTIVLPATCTAGQCAAIGTQLSTAFDTVTCTGATACSCTLQKTTVTNDATTFTVAGPTVTTADGDTYNVCQNGNDLEYQGAGPSSEEGIFKLAKR